MFHFLQNVTVGQPVIFKNAYHFENTSGIFETTQKQNFKLPMQGGVVPTPR